MKNVPSYAMVPKDEYRFLRRELQTTCEAVGFNFFDVWAIMIDTIEKRHHNVIKGRAKNELTLHAAVTSMQKQVMEDRARRLAEKVGA